LYSGEVRAHREALSSFSGDEDMAAVIEAWLSKGKRARLADAWVKGFEVDWRRLYGEQPPRPVSLPVYPFRRESYWVPIDLSGRTVGPAADQSDEALAVHRELLQKLDNGDLEAEDVIGELSAASGGYQ
jgi:polyketide synthase PksL